MSFLRKITARKQRNPRFVIWTPSYDEKSGGVIALHTLCHRLTKLGFAASLWPAIADIPQSKEGASSFAKLRSKLHYRRYYREIIKGFDTGPFENSFADPWALENSIVVYPEIVAQNPLGSASVVRWLLYHPGEHTGETSFGEKDLFFFYVPAFNDPEINADPDNHLRVTMLIQAYRQTSSDPRSGTCVLFYKGKDRVLDQHPVDAICVDEMSHEERAEVFNRSTYLYSYDLYSFYNVYAAICGCIPVIIPEEGVSRDQWNSEPGHRFGLAYGEAEIEWAKETRPALLNRLQEDRTAEDRMVLRFVQKCNERFGAG